MDIIDVSDWQLDNEHHISGTRIKHWIINPETEERYMFKIPKSSNGEVWAEKIAADIGRIIGLTIQDVKFAFRNRTLGVLTKNFRTKGEEFFEGGDLFYAIDQTFDRYSLEKYELPLIIRVLSEYNLTHEFIDIPVFDALIANQDRHCDNWGIISANNQYLLAPIYDNGSSLGFNLSEERIIKMFNDNHMFNAFTNRSHSLIGLINKRKPRHLELLHEIKKQFPEQLEVAINRLHKLNEQNVKDIINDIPDIIMKDIFKQWILKLVIFRKRWLLAWYDGGEANEN